MKPSAYNLEIYRGDTAKWLFVLWVDAAKTQPFDLTGWSAASEIRLASGKPVIVTIICDVTLPNQILLLMNPEDTAICPERGVWDLQLTSPSGDVRTMVAGHVCTTGDVTDSTRPSPLIRKTAGPGRLQRPSVLSKG